MHKFFILGCPRSGTTMLQQALNRHSQIAIPPETKFFFSFFRRSRRRQLRHLQRLNDDLHIDLPPPSGRLTTTQEGRDFFDLMARQYLEHLAKPGVAWFGEKSPEHSGYLERIHQLFPEAKILLLHRDGRDVAVSLTTVPWASRDLYVNFSIWLYYTSLLREAAQADSPNIYSLRYEDLVSAPASTLSGVMRFLGLPDEPAVAEGWGNREGIPEREYPWKGRALQRITPDRVGVFRRELSVGQLEILERLGRHALPSLGYPLLTTGDRRLSATFRLKLLFNLSKFLWRVPWSGVLDAVLSRVFRGTIGCPTEETGHAALADLPAACGTASVCRTPRTDHGLLSPPVGQ
jgi:hypothetical protein